MNRDIFWWLGLVTPLLEPGKRVWRKGLLGGIWRHSRFTIHDAFSCNKTLDPLVRLYFHLPPYYSLPPTLSFTLMPPSSISLLSSLVSNHSLQTSLNHPISRRQIKLTYIRKTQTEAHTPSLSSLHSRQLPLCGFQMAGSDAKKWGCEERSCSTRKILSRRGRTEWWWDLVR